MLRSLKELENYTVYATDGDIGRVDSFLLDGEHWTVRYLAVKTNGSFQGQEVVLSPASFLKSDWSSLRFNVALTRDKVQHSPPFDPEKPFSQELEGEFFQYYGHLPYWGFAGHWGPGTYPSALSTSAVMTPNVDRPSSIHLRNAREVRGYHVVGTDQAIGHIEDFIVDDETWEIRYLVIDTSNWWFGKKVLISPRWVTHISWEERLVEVDMSQHAIQSSPEWEPTRGVNRDYEARLYDYYGRPSYWQ